MENFYLSQRYIIGNSFLNCLILFFMIILNIKYSQYNYLSVLHQLGLITLVHIRVTANLVFLRKLIDG